MTGTKWNRCTELDPMLHFLLQRDDRKLCRRKLPLFAAACARRVWHLLQDPRCREALGVVERFWDGLASEEEVAEAVTGADDAAMFGPGAPDARNCAAQAVAFATPDNSEVDEWAAQTGASWARDAVGKSRSSGSPDQKESWRRATQEEGLAQANLLRCILGNPFRPLTPDPAILTATIVSLAQPAYDDRLLPSGHLDPARLAVLSDALEEAGARGPVLDHLRSPGPHVRGCWALDAVLGKE